MVDVCLAVVTILACRPLEVVDVTGGLQVDEPVGTYDIGLALELPTHDGAHGGLLIGVGVVTYGLVEVEVTEHLIGKVMHLLHLLGQEHEHLAALGTRLLVDLGVSARAVDALDLGCFLRLKDELMEEAAPCKGRVVGGGDTEHGGVVKQNLDVRVGQVLPTDLAVVVGVVA